jgi:hypothetical protein|uniref:Uncharacterized protein n=1 Tax=Zea mays TaxID=4577 RepID=A0A804N7K9_MAIZE
MLLANCTNLQLQFALHGVRRAKASHPRAATVRGVRGRQQWRRGCGRERERINGRAMPPLLSNSAGKIKRDLCATNPKSERRKRGSRSSRPTDGRTDRKTDVQERKLGAHRYARVRRGTTATMTEHCLSASCCLVPAAAPTHHPSLHLKRGYRDQINAAECSAIPT